MNKTPCKDKIPEHHGSPFGSGNTDNQRSQTYDYSTKYKNGLSIIIMLVICINILFLTRSAHAAGDPIIYPVASTTGVTVAYVVWSTDIASTSLVEYGATKNYGSTKYDDIPSTWHKMTLTGLAPNSVYHFRVTSGATISDDYSFSTYAAPTGTVKTVGSGKDYSTIQACAAASSPGWTCLIYSGSYGTVTSASNNVTFMAQEDATVTSFNITGKTNNQVKGFNIYNTSANGIDAGLADNAFIENNYIEARGGRGIKIYDNAPANDVTIRKNIIYHSGWTTGGSGASQGIYISGDRNLVDSNDISHGADFINAGGANNVIRNNLFHHVSHAEIGGSEHLDGTQVTGLTWNFSLFENNIEYSCIDATKNCHFFIVRNQTAAPADNIIMRYNFASSLDGSGISFGGLNDSVPNAHFYNNTIATGTFPAENGDCASFQNAPYGVVLNNICYNSMTASWAPFYGAATANSNIAYVTGYNGAWNSPYSSEATYALLRNKNPLFTNYPYGASIQISSPAKDAGAALTTVATGDSGSGTNLVLSDARFFQPGWAGTQADWIAVGTATNIAQVSSINYTTNSITLVNGIIRSSGQQVWLYKKSDGTRVLNGITSSIGASYDRSIELTAPSNIHIIN